MASKIYIVWQDEVDATQINEFAYTEEARIEARECLNFVRSNSAYTLQKIICGTEIEVNNL